MCVDGGVASGAGQILAVAVGDVLSCLRVPEPLGQPEINHIHIVLLLSDTYKEVVWLDIPVQEVPRMHKLNSLQLSKKTL